MSLDSLKRRLKTVKSTGKITKAMSLISAAQLKNVKKLYSSYEPYASLTHNLTHHLASSLIGGDSGEFILNDDGLLVPDEFVIDSLNQFMEVDVNAASHKSDSQKKLVIAITAEKGLCGAFNNGVISKVLQIASHHDTDILCIGKKGHDAIAKTGQHHILREDYIEMHVKHARDTIVMGKITKPILFLIGSGKYNSVQIVYTHFLSMLKQRVVVKDLFPLMILDESSQNHYPGSSHEDSIQDALSDLIPYYMHSIIYQIVLDSLKSETSKRMISMDNASTNCKGMIDSLTLKYNRARQTKVTMELIEVISGIQ